MENKEMQTIGMGPAVLGFEDVIDGWRYAASIFKEGLNSTDKAYEPTCEILKEQNSAFIEMMKDPECSDEKYKDLSQHVRDIRGDTQTVTMNRMSDVIQIISLFASIAAIALGGGHMIKPGR